MGEGRMSMHPSRTIFKLALVAVILFGGPPALAQETATLSAGNSAWILTSTALVLFMTLPGLALFYGGLVQSRNVLSVLMHCFTICCLVSVLWLVVVYGLAFGDGGGANQWIGGFGKAFLIGVGVLTYVIVKVVGALVGLRVSEDDENEGLDITAHGERGYSL